ncbi:MAG: twin-arginine translocase TatA/TatE family subunit [Chloroflexi bacterium]|nr:twin-arginine translocase TatA/TatE family subunit [Chloroflexota bacterium]
MPFRMGPMELIIILVIVMLVFGVGKLSSIGGALGKSIREFRKGSSGEEEPPVKGEVSRNGIAPTH